MTTVLSSLSSIGLVIMSFWFVGEMLVYRRYDGHMWLADFLSGLRDQAKTSLASASARVHPYRVWHSGKKHFARAGPRSDPEEAVEGTTPTQEIGLGYRTALESILSEENTNLSFWLSCDKAAMTREEIARHRWREAIRQIRLRVRELQAPPAYSGPQRIHAYEDGIPDLRRMLPNIRATVIVPKLHQMTITQELHRNDRHDALVRFLRFSPDGQFLVTSSWDRKSHIINLTQTLNCERTITHPYGPGLVHQVEWAPDGKKLLMRRNRSITLWNTEGKQLLEIPREESDPDFRSVAWYGQNSWLFVGGSTVFTTNVDGKEPGTHHINNLLVRDVAVTNDHKWMLCVGKYHHSDEKAHKKTHQIVLYDLANFSIVKRYPVFHELCDITLAEDNKSILVSYENRAPPQLWELHVPRHDNPPTLILRHTYMPQVPTAFAGFPASFGGPQDELVLRVGSAGGIYVWDRYSANLLHQIQAPSELGNLTAFTWSRTRGRGEWMFATGNHEGGVHIWTIPTPEHPALVISAPREEKARSQTFPEKAMSASPDLSRLEGRVESPVGEGSGAGVFFRRDSGSSVGSDTYSDDNTLRYWDGD